MDEKTQPRDSDENGGQHVASAQVLTCMKPQNRKLHDPTVTLEEYLFYAQQTRAQEDTYESPKLRWREILTRSKPETKKNDEPIDTVAGNVVPVAAGLDNVEGRLQISDKEWEDASRALRTASWGACFYLVTTDVLGPYGIAFSFGTLGWGPGIALYTVFGLMAGYSGYLIWRCFLGVDSYAFPCRNYGDLAFRCWGSIARHVTNIIQGIALLLILGQVTIQYGMAISQISKFRLCYIVCPLLFVSVGFLLTQIRTLKAYGLVANFAIWLNLLVIFLTMGFISSSPPNYAAATLGSAGSAVDPASIIPDKVTGEYPPVIKYSGLPANNLIGSINGLLSGVLAYAGAQLFTEFLAELAKPRDFLKAMWLAQLFIYVVYMAYGSFVYYYQGQYAYNPSYQGVSRYSWQTAGNAISLLAGLIAAGLYGNIGCKVVFNNVLVDLLGAPTLVTKPGKILYAVLVPVYWITAFLIAASIPDYFGFVSVMSASTLLNMTCTLPPLFALGFDCQRHAVRADKGEGFDPVKGHVVRLDSGISRLLRGYMAGGRRQVAINIWHTIYFLASLSMCGLGMYAAIQGMIEVFDNPQVTSFSCRSPLDLSPG